MTLESMTRSQVEAALAKAIENPNEGVNIGGIWVWAPTLRRRLSVLSEMQWWHGGPNDPDGV